MRVEQALIRITNAQRARLEWSFEAGQPDMVKVGDVWLGVHLHLLHHLELVDREGKWATARKKHVDA